MKQESIRFIDMFAGIGGFREGLQLVGGFQCVGFCECDKYAQQSYRALFDCEEEWYSSDARKIDPDELPEFDLLCGGFPCQAFSVAGHRKGFGDPRGTLFFELARLAEARKPRYLLFENVPGLLMQSLAAAILAGGWVAVVIILLICLIALVMGSSYGIFFGVESTGSGTSVSQAVRNLNQEYADHLQQISESVSHDRQEMTSNDGSLSINWQEVLAVFSAKVSGASDGEQVASLTDAQVDILRDILWEMNDVDYSTHTESHEVEVTTTNDDGEEETTTETVIETVLTIEITHKTAADMAQEYRFDRRQKEYLDLMMQPDNQNLWAQLLGGLVAGGGQIIIPDTDWVPIGVLAWPLPQTFSISSPFGYREDPFTGEIEYHNGTDIAAPNGTQILAAAAGTVTIANGIDPWGGSYGYHIKIDHGNGLETLYAHCSSICVTPGQQVQQGEVIGFVGSTGNSTGNHLHFEVWVSGERTDAMSFFSGN